MAAFNTPEMLERDASVVVKHGRCGLQIYGLGNLPFRRLELVLLQKKNTKKVCGFGMLRLQCQNGPIGFFSFCNPPALVKDLRRGEVGRHVAALAGVVGIFLFKRWGRALSLYSTALGFLLVPFIGPGVYSGLTSALDEVSFTLWGAVLAMAYFSPLAERFRSDAA